MSVQVKHVGDQKEKLLLNDIKGQENTLLFGETLTLIETDDVVNSIARGAIKEFIDAGKLEIVAPQQSADIIKIKNWIISNDVQIVYDTSVNSGSKEGVDIEVRVTDGDSTIDTFNSVASVEITTTGGTASTINGSAAPVEITFTSGIATITLADSASGAVTLGLQNGNTSLNLSSTLVVTLS